MRFARLVFAQDIDGGKHGDYGTYVKMWADAKRAQRARAGFVDPSLHVLLEHFAVDGYALIPATCQPWYVKIVEMYFNLLERGQSDVFQLWKGPLDTGKVVDDSHRKLTDLRQDRLLWSLIVGPVTEAMGSLGFLDIVGTPEGGERVSRDGSYLVSVPFQDEDIKHQGFHTDGDPTEANEHGLEFALYTITAGFQGAEVHLHRGHMGGSPDKYGKEEGVAEPIMPIRVLMQPGDTLVLSPGTRHRGTGYVVENHRFFVSFKAGKSWGAREGSTHKLQLVGDTSEEYALGELDTWEMDSELRKERKSGNLF